MERDDVPKYGISERTVINDEIDSHIEEIEYDGYTVIDSGLGAAELQQMRISLDQNYQRQLAETAAASALMSADTDTLRCPLAYDDLFLRAATAEPLMEICKRMLGPNFVLLQQNAV